MLYWFASNKIYPTLLPGSALVLGLCNPSYRLCQWLTNVIAPMLYVVCNPDQIPMGSNIKCRCKVKLKFFNYRKVIIITCKQKIKLGLFDKSKDLKLIRLLSLILTPVPASQMFFCLPKAINKDDKTTWSWQNSSNELIKLTRQKIFRD